ncbi:5-hydroxytryptamine receptor 3C-like isoform X1 [Gouania willdenowi]|uniref:5-hydroxytryptamine receptor 3C-like isoform X1 n=1 Tax=Gouania willdenowi TaxID=441366 RepID=UPI0010541CD3|nr:5-hydroxytryptamine receptor 3C-like isoform X1 [Gouania willdenowi]XP_028301251.1 5-hydroxytryptamine receptor 3C-like isoform X1 [Gouania willdenowi]
MKTPWILFFCSLLPGLGDTLNCSSPTPEALFDSLEKEVFSKKLLRPVKSFSETLKVTLEATLVGILGVNEKSQSLATFIWLAQKWNIQGLSWDEKECGTSKVSISREKLWIPDISISEFMEEDKSPKTFYAYLNNHGQVTDDKPVRVASFCKLDIYTFPFDIQNCTMTFGPYLHTADEILMIQGHSAELSLQESREVLLTKGEWELKNILITASILEIAHGNYSEIKYYFILRRRPILYVVNLLLPSCFLITLDLFSFLLPPATTDRSAFKMTLILGYTVFLLTMNDLLPVTGHGTPLLNVFFSISLALMVASLLETICITNIQFRSDNYIPVPHWLSVLVLRYLAAIVCLPQKRRSTRLTVSLSPEPKVLQPELDPSIISSRDLHSVCSNIQSEKLHPDPTVEELRKLSKGVAVIRQHLDRHFEGTRTSREWQMIGVIIDRLLFGIYIIFITISFLIVVIIWVTNNIK